MAARNPPWTIPAGLANRSSATARHVVLPGSALVDADQAEREIAVRWDLEARSGPGHGSSAARKNTRRCWSRRSSSDATERVRLEQRLEKRHVTEVGEQRPVAGEHQLLGVVQSEASCVHLALEEGSRLARASGGERRRARRPFARCPRVPPGEQGGRTRGSPRRNGSPRSAHGPPAPTRRVAGRSPLRREPASRRTKPRSPRGTRPPWRGKWCSKLGRRDADELGDVVQRGPVEAALGKTPERGIQDRLPRRYPWAPDGRRRHDDLHLPDTGGERARRRMSSASELPAMPTYQTVGTPDTVLGCRKSCWRCWRDWPPASLPCSARRSSSTGRLLTGRSRCDPLARWCSGF